MSSLMGGLPFRGLPDLRALPASLDEPESLGQLQWGEGVEFPETPFSHLRSGASLNPIAQGECLPSG